MRGAAAIAGSSSSFSPRVTVLTACQSEPPEEISNVLLIGDAGALLTYFLGLSTARTLALA